MDINTIPATATIGMFDGVHRGHRFLLDTLKQLSADTRPLVITFNDHPLTTLNPAAAPRLLSTPSNKQARLLDTGVDVVMLDFDRALASMTAREFLDRLAVQYGVKRLLLGFNNRFGSDRSLTHNDYIAIGREAGIEVITAPSLDSPLTVSSSAIRTALTNGNVNKASTMLGYNYRLTGTVVPGKRLGRQLGFPTANISLDDDRLVIPASGVYHCIAVDETGSQYNAAVNIGVRPTVDNSPHPDTTIEAHLIGLDRDIYGQTLSIDFVDRIRPEQRFDSLDSLKQQLADDIAVCSDFSLHLHK